MLPVLEYGTEPFTRLMTNFRVDVVNRMRAVFGDRGEIRMAIEAEYRTRRSTRPP